VIYLDAGVFLSAALDKGAKGKRARELLREVQGGKTPAATSALTFDEVFWIVKKHRSFDDALQASKALLEMPNLIFLEVNDEVLWRSHALAEQYKLNPRDAIHAACALTHGIFTMVSEDEDFDRVKEIERRNL